MGYWGKVFARAWTDTKESFGWNQKTLLTVVVAVAGVVGTLFQLGFGAAFASATGLLWIALPVASVAFVVFAWNCFSAIIDVELSRRADQKSAAPQQPPPNYEAWRHVDRLTLREAAYLWCDLSPEGSMPSNVRAWYEALASAVRKGELNLEYRPSGRMMGRDADFDYQKDNPDLNTTVKRTALQAWAKKHNYDPKFLRDA